MTNRLQTELDIISYPTKTYRLDTEKKRIIGYVDGLAAMEQAIYKILMTERFKHVIYSFNYGTEHFELMGRLYPYVYSALRGYISEAVMQDDRVRRVYDFTFSADKQKRSLLVRFKVDTTEGELDIEREVQTDV